MKGRKTPQEKKSLSYARDRRNTYGESDKGSRTSIKRNKTKPSRAYRRSVNQILQSEASSSDLQNAELLDAEVRSVKRRKWRKCPDTPLGQYVKERLERRSRSVGAKIKRRAEFKRRMGEQI